MKRHWWFAAGALVVLSAAPQAVLAQRNSNGLNNGLLFYYTWSTNNRTQQMYRQQQRMDRQFTTFEQQTVRQLHRPDPYQDYVRQGRVTGIKERPLPPIYAGQRNYFMRTDAFQPQQRRGP